MNIYTKEEIEYLIGGKVVGSRFKGIEKERSFTFSIPNIDYETNSNFPCFIHCIGITYPNRNYCISRMHSPVYVLEYILEGEGYIEIDKKIIHVKKGDAYLLPRFTKYKYYADTKNPFKKCWVNFLANHFDAVLLAFGIKDVIHFPNTNILFEMQNILSLEKISTISQNISLLGYKYILEIVQKLSESHFQINIEANDYELDIKNYLERSIHEFKTLDEFCAYRGIDKMHLIKLFKKRFGITPYQYFLDCKIKKAKQLLATTSYPMSQIADYLGFCDVYSFANRFKQRAGMTPSEYRKTGWKNDQFLNTYIY